MTGKMAANKKVVTWHKNGKTTPSRPLSIPNAITALKERPGITLSPIVGAKKSTSNDVTITTTGSGTSALAPSSDNVHCEEIMSCKCYNCSIRKQAGKIQTQVCFVLTNFFRGRFFEIICNQKRIL